MIKITQKLWNMITHILSSISARNADHALNFNIWTQQKEHSRVWNIIFQNENWIIKVTKKFNINSILISSNLHTYYNNDSQKYKSAYIILKTDNTSEDLQYHKELFLKFLKSHTFREETEEVEFKLDITLNIISTLYNSEIIYMETKRLFLYQHKQLQTFYLYWQDSQWTLRTLRSKNIVEIEESTSFIDDITYICDLNFTLSDDQWVQHIYATSVSEWVHIWLIKIHRKSCTEWEFY